MFSLTNFRFVEDPKIYAEAYNSIITCKHLLLTRF